MHTRAPPSAIEALNDLGLGQVEASTSRDDYGEVDLKVRHIVALDAEQVNCHAEEGSRCRCVKSVYG